MPSPEDASSVTLLDVARAAGVSMATASRALNGSSRNVSPGNRARVLQAAAELGYTPHLSAQAIATGSTRTAALVVSDIADQYFSSIAAGAVQAAETAGLIVTMAVSGRSPERELEIVTTLRGYRPRAIILAGSRIDDGGIRDALISELQAYETAGGRVVLVSQPMLPFSTVTIDNFRATKDLAVALVQRGYRRFATIRGPQQLHTARDRFDGFLAGLRSAQLTVEDRCVVTAEFSHAGGYGGAEELLRRGLAGTELIFTGNDVMALGAMRAIRDAGLVPGRDIAVAGFDDIPAAVDVDPILTTVRAPLELMGVRAVELAVADEPELKILRMPTEVLLRDSSPSRPDR